MRGGTRAGIGASDLVLYWAVVTETSSTVVAAACRCPGWDLETVTSSEDWRLSPNRSPCQLPLWTMAASRASQGPRGPEQCPAGTPEARLCLEGVVSILSGWPISSSSALPSLWKQAVLPLGLMVSP